MSREGVWYVGETKHRPVFNRKRDGILSSGETKRHPVSNRKRDGVWSSVLCKEGILFSAWTKRPPM